MSRKRRLTNLVLIGLLLNGVLAKQEEEQAVAGEPKTPWLLLGIGVLSKSSNFRLRQAVRGSMGTYRCMVEGRARLKFFVAEPADADVMVELEQEAARYSDMVMVQAKEGYSNVPKQTVAVFEHYISADPAMYIIKSDDDVVVRADKLCLYLEALLAEKGSKARLYVGWMVNGATPHRGGKWAVTKEEFPGDVYPRYASGPCYLVSSPLAKRIIRKKSELSPLRLEDVAVGMWVEMIEKSVRVTVIDERRFWKTRVCEEWSFSVLIEQGRPLLFELQDVDAAMRTLVSRDLANETEVCPHGTRFSDVMERIECQKNRKEGSAGWYVCAPWLDAWGQVSEGLTHSYGKSLFNLYPGGNAHIQVQAEGAVMRECEKARNEWLAGTWEDHGLRWRAGERFGSSSVVQYLTSAHQVSYSTMKSVERFGSSSVMPRETTAATSGHHDDVGACVPGQDKTSCMAGRMDGARELVKHEKSRDEPHVAGLGGWVTGHKEAVHILLSDDMSEYHPHLQHEGIQEHCHVPCEFRYLGAKRGDTMQQANEKPKQLHAYADAVVFLGDLELYRPQPGTRPVARYGNADNVVAVREALSKFPRSAWVKYDLNVTYELKAHATYGYIDSIDALLEEARQSYSMGERSIFASGVVLRCGKKGDEGDRRAQRVAFMEDLARLVDLQSFGHCANNKKWPPGQDKNKTYVTSISKFCLAYENSVDVDYVTEKLFDCLRLGAIPVVSGGMNIRKFAPPGCCLFVEDFDSVQDLAREMVDIAANEKRFNEMRAWIWDDESSLHWSKWASRMRKIEAASVRCRLCGAVAQRRGYTLKDKAVDEVKRRKAYVKEARKRRRREEARRMQLSDASKVRVEI